MRQHSSMIKCVAMVARLVDEGMAWRKAAKLVASSYALTDEQVRILQSYFDEEQARLHG